MVIATYFLAAAAVAAQPIEAETQATGTVDVPAQGYQVSTFFMMASVAGLPTPKPETDRKAAMEAANAIGTVKTPTCNAISKLGFVGNESIGGPAPDESEVGGLPAYSSYRGVFIKRDDAERARAILEKAGATGLGISPVLFQCEASTSAAKEAAMKVSRSNAEDYARMLGLRVGAMTKLSDISDGSWMNLMQQATRAREDAPDNSVRVTATLTVTYRLEN